MNRRALLILSASIVALHLLQETFLGGSPAGSFVANTLQSISAVLAALMCLGARRRGSGFARTFWLLIACSFVAWGVANLGWIYYESFRHMEPPVDSVFPFLVTTRDLFLAMALLLDQKEESLLPDLTSFLDFVQLAIIFTLIYLGWYYLPSLLESQRMALLRSAQVEIGEDIVVIALALLQTARASTPSIRRLYLGFLTYFVLLTIGSVVTDYRQMVSFVSSGSWLDLWWTIPYLMAAYWASCWLPGAGFFPASRPEKRFANTLLDKTMFAIAPLIVLWQAVELGPRWRQLSFSLLAISILCFAVRLALSEFREARSAAIAHKSDLDRLEAESKFRTAFQANPQGLTITTWENGTYMEVNDSFLTTVEYERAELLGKSALDLKLWVDKQERVAMVEKLRRDGRVMELEVRFRTKSGKERQLLLSAHPFQLHGQSCILCILNDVTERRILERQFYQAQRMEAVGRLAGGVAHDFNNILMIASANAQFAEEAREYPERVERYARQIQKATDRGASLTRQLLAFSRQQILKPAVLDLNAVITELWKLLPPLLGEDIKTVLSLDSGLGCVNADRAQVEQVIMNLAVNARDAMPRGGSLTVETTNLVLDGDFAIQGVALAAGRYVLLSIKDTGTGMTPEVQAHIFDPFFTTKELGKGTGLGLATVYGIVKQSGGYIRVSSEENKGSTFEIYLPRVEPSGAEVHAISGRELLSAGAGTILIVEDEPDLRRVASEYLRAKGFQVLEAATGRAALELCNSHNGSIDLLITDMVMPEGSGPAVARAAADARPGLRTIFMSGYTDGAMVESLGPQATFFQKPFSMDALARKIHEVLNGKN
jgi:PAS domain S-box-containing protein